MVILAALFILFTPHGASGSSDIACDTFVHESVTQCVNGETGETVGAWLTEPASDVRIVVEPDE